MVNTNAFVTLLTSETYIQGVVALAHSLHLTNTQNEIVCMVTKDISSDIVEKLEKPGELFNRVIYVDEYDSEDQKNLELLDRPELGITFTKLNVWKLVQYDYVAFLDADTIVLRNIDTLFDQIKQVYNQGNVAFIAAPDVGWPDHFNSGVFVCKPDLQIYSDLINCSQSMGSFDGGDQGLLNRYFNQWNNIPNARLSFKYNVTPSTFYTYAPAYQEHQDDIKVVHFIGNNKPWLSSNSQGMRKKKNLSTPTPFDTFIDAWWNIYGNYIVKNGQLYNETINSKAMNYSDHPYDNAWQTNVIQNVMKENESEEDIKEIIEDKPECKSNNIENNNNNDESIQNVNRNENIDESKTSTDTIRYKWQIHAKINDDVFPLNSSSSHPTDHAFITKKIETNKEYIIEPKENIESQPRDLNIDLPKPINFENTQITNTIVVKDKPQIIEQSPRELTINSNENVSSFSKNIPLNKLISNHPKSSNTKISKNNTKHIKERRTERENPIHSSNSDDFGSYHIRWNLDELRGFRRQYRKYLKETEKFYNPNKSEDTIDTINKEASISQSEPETESMKENDEILNISSLPGLHVTELNEEEEEEQEESVSHESSFKAISNDKDVNIEEFDIYGFSYQDDIKKKSFTNDSDDGSVKSAGRKRRRSIVEVMYDFDGLSMTKIPTAEEDKNSVDRSAAIEEPLDVTGIIEDNFENDLFINEDEIENISFVKNRSHIMNDISEIENISFVKNRSHIMNDISEIENGNRSFVSYKDIEKDNIIVEPIPYAEVTEVIENANDTIFPNDISIEEEIIINESIIPSEIIGDREVILNNSEIPSEIIKPNVEKYEDTETEITAIPRFSNIIEVHNVEVQPQQFIHESNNNLDTELIKPTKFVNKKLIRKSSVENSLSLEEPTMINSTFNNRSTMTEIPVILEEEEESGEHSKMKDQTMIDSNTDEMNTESIFDDNVEEEIINTNEDLDSIIDDIETTLRKIINEDVLPEEEIEVSPKEIITEEIKSIPKETIVDEVKSIPRENILEEIKTTPMESILEDIKTTPREANVKEAPKVPGLKKKSSIIIKTDDANGQDSSYSIEISEIEKDDDLLNHITISHSSSNDSLNDDVQTSVYTTKKPKSIIINENQEITEIEESVISYEMKKINDPKIGYSVEEVYNVLIEDVIVDSEGESDEIPRDITLKDVDVVDIDKDIELEKFKEEPIQIIDREANVNININKPNTSKVVDVIQEKEPERVILNDEDGPYTIEIIDVIQELDPEVAILDNENGQFTYDFVDVIQEKEPEDEAIQDDEDGPYTYEIVDVIQEKESEDETIPDDDDDGPYTYEIVDVIQEKEPEDEVIPNDEDGPYTYEIVDVIQEKESEDEAIPDDEDGPYTYEIVDVIQEKESEDEAIPDDDDDGPYTYEIVDVIQEKESEDEAIPDDEDEPYAYEIVDVIQDKEPEEKEIIPKDENEPYTYEIVDVVQEKEPEEEIISNNRNIIKENNTFEVENDDKINNDIYLNKNIFLDDPPEEVYRYEIEDTYLNGYKREILSDDDIYEIIIEDVIQELDDKKTDIIDEEVEEEEIFEYETHETIEQDYEPDVNDIEEEEEEEIVKYETHEVVEEDNLPKNVNLDDLEEEVVKYETHETVEESNIPKDSNLNDSDEEVEEEVVKYETHETVEENIEPKEVNLDIPEEVEEEEVIKYETHETVEESNVSKDANLDIPEEVEEEEEIVKYEINEIVEESNVPKDINLNNFDEEIEEEEVIKYETNETVEENIEPKETNLDIPEEVEEEDVIEYETHETIEENIEPKKINLDIPEEVEEDAVKTNETIEHDIKKEQEVLFDPNEQYIYEIVDVIQESDDNEKEVELDPNEPYQYEIEDEVQEINDNEKENLLESDESYQNENIVQEVINKEKDDDIDVDATIHLTENESNRDRSYYDFGNASTTIVQEEPTEIDNSYIIKEEIINNLEEELKENKSNILQEIPEEIIEQEEKPNEVEESQNKPIPKRKRIMVNKYITITRKPETGIENVEQQDIEVTRKPEDENENNEQQELKTEQEVELKEQEPLQEQEVEGKDDEAFIVEEVIIEEESITESDADEVETSNINNENNVPHEDEILISNIQPSEEQESEIINIDVVETEKQPIKESVSKIIIEPKDQSIEESESKNIFDDVVETKEQLFEESEEQLIEEPEGKNIVDDNFESEEQLIEEPESKNVNDTIESEKQSTQVPENEIVTSEVVEDVDPVDGHIIYKRVIKRIIRRNGNVIIETEEQPLEEKEVKEDSPKGTHEVVTSEVVEETDPQDGHIIRKRIIKRIINRNGNISIETEEQPMNEQENTSSHINTSKETAKSSPVETNDSEIINSEVVEEVDPLDGHIIRKRIIKRIIRRNGNVIIETEEQPIEEVKESKEQPQFGIKDGEVVTSEVVEETDPQDGHIIRKRVIKRIIRRNGNVIIETEEQPIEEVDSDIPVERKGKFASVPFLAENDDVLLLTIIIFGNDQKELLKQFEMATNDFYLNRITAEEYYTLYITILKKLCEVKGVDDERYQSLETPFMAEHSEQLWNSIAEAFANENKIHDVEEEDEKGKKRRVRCFPFFKFGSKRKHSHKHKKSKSVDHKNKTSKSDETSDKKQAMKDVMEKHKNEKDSIEDRIETVVIEKVEEESPEEEEEAQALLKKQEIVHRKESSQVKSEEQKPDTSSNVLPVDEIVATPTTAKKDNKKKEKKRWWKKLTKKHLHKKKEE